MEGMGLKDLIEGVYVPVFENDSKEFINEIRNDWPVNQ